jgi:hypothetical protein
MPDIRNIDQLRHAIDQGHAGDKVRHSDPAAAPLGTDAEAGGISPTPEELRSMPGQPLVAAIGKDGIFGPVR